MGRGTPLIDAWILVATVYGLVVCGGAADAYARWASPSCLGAGAALVWAVRARGGVPRLATPGRRVAPVFALGLAAGFASLPAWIALIWRVGAGLRLPTVGAGGGEAAGPLGWASAVVFAPLLEEMLYRERLLGALRPHVGLGPAILLSSAAFAAPHGEPWRVLGTFLVGIALGAIAAGTRSLVLCIGLHAGLNLAALVCGVPPARLALPVAAAGAAGWLGVGAAVAVLRPAPQRGATERLA